LFSGATLANPDDTALVADRLTVDQGMACTQGFTAKGEIYLVDAHIGGQLNFHEVTLSNPAGVALDLERLRADTLILLPKTPPKGTVYLTDANVNTYSDSQATWPPDLRLGGFTYGALHASPEVDATKRLRWLEHDPGGYIPQLYEQLAAAYRKAGRDEDARKVAIAKQRRRRQVLHPASKVWNSLLYWTVGYGYRTWQAVLWLLGFLLVSWVVFARAYPAYMSPTKKPGDPLPHFQPLVYALDTLLPVVDLHQQDSWIPRELAQWWAWTSILAGWILTTAVVAALTGLIKKD
jgi:hypothetical protein